MLLKQLPPLLLLSSLPAWAHAAAPTGSYCGGIPGIVDNVRMDIDDESTFDISFKVFGQTSSCQAEEYSYDEGSGNVVVPNLGDRTDCLGGVLSSFGVSPSQVTIGYDEDGDAINVNAMGQKVSLTECPSDNDIEPNMAPQGSYCTTIFGLYDVRVDIDDETHLDVSTNVAGVPISCPREGYTFDDDSSVLNIPGLDSKSDCLGHYASTYGIGTSSVDMTYDQRQDTITVKVSAFGDDNRWSLKQVFSQCPAIRSALSAPKGSYCGGIPGIVDNVRMDIDDESTFDISFKVFGQTSSCQAEEYSYDEGSGNVDVPNLGDRTDCLGGVLSSFGVSPSQLTIGYDEDGDAINVNAMGQNVSLTQCPTTMFLRR